METAALVAVIGSIVASLVGTIWSNSAARKTNQESMDFTREMTESAREYNNPGETVSRLVSAGASEGGALSSVLGATPYYAPVSSTPSLDSGSSALASLFGSLAGNMSNAGESFRDFAAAETENTIRAYKVAQVQAEINHLAEQDKWTEQQIESAQGMLEIAKEHNAKEIEKMDAEIAEFEKQIEEIDIRMQKELQEIAESKSRESLNKAEEMNKIADTYLKQKQGVCENWRAGFIEHWEVDPNASMPNMLVQAAMSSDPSTITNGIIDNADKMVSGTVTHVVDKATKGFKQVCSSARSVCKKLIRR